MYLISRNGSPQVILIIHRMISSSSKALTVSTRYLVKMTVSRQTDAPLVEPGVSVVTLTVFLLPPAGDRVYHTGSGVAEDLVLAPKRCMTWCWAAGRGSPTWDSTSKKSTTCSRAWPRPRLFTWTSWADPVCQYGCVIVSKKKCGVNVWYKRSKDGFD